MFVCLFVRCLFSLPKVQHELHIIFMNSPGICEYSNNIKQYCETNPPRNSSYIVVNLIHTRHEKNGIPTVYIPSTSSSNEPPNFKRLQRQVCHTQINWSHCSVISADGKGHFVLRLLLFPGCLSDDLTMKKYLLCRSD